jgi:broad specificity phosphatase PhoE
VPLIYLRHGDDRGDDVYRHDRRLTDRGKKKAAKAAERLIEEHGHPDAVFCSPYRRAWQTLEAMIPHFDRAVDVHRDRRVAQHLSTKQRRLLSISPETLTEIEVNEDRDAFRRRVLDHVEDVRRRASTGARIWCITHQMVVEEVAGHFGMKISGELDFLDHVVVLG